MNKQTILCGLTLLLLAGCAKQEVIEKPKKVFVAKQSNIQKDNTTEVLIDKEIKKEDIQSYYQHGDHWHVITKDGKEHITYTNPEQLEAGKVIDTVQVVQQAKLANEAVVAIKKHGNHWHVYTSTGKEYLTYSDPSALYPNIRVEEYVGSHANTDTATLEKSNEKEVATTSTVSPTVTKELKILPVLGKPEVNRHDIVRILQHGDHYHLYDSNGNEGLTYEDPRTHYPQATFGEYQGSHQDAVSTEIQWPSGITKIISHKDHWHLYKGDTEVAIVQVNPRNQYPEAEWIEEASESETIGVDTEELFTYDEIEAKKIPSLLPLLSNNLKAMTHFGSIHSTIPVFGSNGQTEDVFYWLHNDHYHAISIKQLIQKAKAGEFQEHSARDVVAVLKYKILHPNESLEVEITVDADEVKEFLMQYYGITDRRDVMRLYDSMEVYKNGETISIHLSQFEKVDGQIRAKVTLPAFQTTSPSESTNGNDDQVTNEIPGNESQSDTTLDTTDKQDKEQENLRKIADYLQISEDDAFDVIYDIIDDVNQFSIADLIVNDDGTVTLGDKNYPLVLPEEE